MILEGLNGLGLLVITTSLMWIGWVLVELFGKDN